MPAQGRTRHDQGGTVRGGNPLLPARQDREIDRVDGRDLNGEVGGVPGERHRQRRRSPAQFDVE